MFVDAYSTWQRETLSAVAGACSLRRQGRSAEGTFWALRCLGAHVSAPSWPCSAASSHWAPWPRDPPRPLPEAHPPGPTSLSLWQLSGSLPEGRDIPQRPPRCVASFLLPPPGPRSPCHYAIVPAPLPGGVCQGLSCLTLSLPSALLGHGPVWPSALRDTRALGPAWQDGPASSECLPRRGDRARRRS